MLMAGSFYVQNWQQLLGFRVIMGVGVRRTPILRVITNALLCADGSQSKLKR